MKNFTNMVPVEMTGSPNGGGFVMSKAQELAALRAFNDALPADTYLRQWLDAVIPEVAGNLKDDIFPWVVPSDAAKEAAAILKAAQARAEAILAEAETTRQRAKLDVSRIIEEQRQAFTKSLQVLKSTLGIFEHVP